MFSNGVGSEAGARAQCALLGGNLATFNSLAEQAEVEGYLVNSGFLLSKFHQ